MNFDFCCNQVLINERNLIHKSRVYSDSESFSDIIIISGRNASIYEIKANKILASHSLNKTILKELLIDGKIASTTPVLINIHFGYNAGEKEHFFFIQIGDRLVIFTKMAHQFMIQHELQDVCEYELDDSNDFGNLEAIITFLNGDTKVIELNNSKINLFPTLVPHSFSKLTSELRYIVMDASSKSFQSDLNFKERLADYNNFNQLNFTKNSNSSENFNILSRFGDTWTRNINNTLLIGIPVCNCSNQKYLIKDLRVSLFNSNQKQIRYKHSIYEFHGNVLNAKSLGTHDIYNNTEQHCNAIINSEWTDMNNVLVAGKSGIILIKLNNLCVGLVQSPSIIIISYKIELPNKYVYDVSTHVGKIELDDRILQKENTQFNFDPTNYFQDILTITATTVMMKYQLKYDNDDDLRELFDILTKELQFNDISQSLDSDDKYLLSTQMNLSSMDDHENCDDDAKVFYCNAFGYWNGTMVQGMVTKSTGTASQQQSYDIKIFNSEEIKIQDLIKLIDHHFGSRISIKPVQGNQSRQSELKYRFREEMAILENIAKQMPNGSNEALLKIIPFLDYQFRTDQHIESLK